MPILGNSRAPVLRLAAVVALFVGALTVLPISRAQQGSFGSLPQDGHRIPPITQVFVPMSIELLTPIPENPDFVAYLDHVHSSVLRNLECGENRSTCLILKYLPSGNGEQKQVAVRVRVHVQSDGSLAPEGAVVIASDSGTKRMKATAREAIRAAAPFGHFPESVKNPSVDLLFTFHFERGASEPKQEPKVVPAAI